MDLKIESLEEMEAPISFWGGVAIVGVSLVVGVGVGLLIT
jgi:hypothetical protein